jgi:hypothetical protein
LGVNVAVRASVDSEIVPATGSKVPFPPGSAYARNVAVVTVSGSIALLNCTWMEALVGTALALYAGLMLATVGVTRSAPGPVVKVELRGAVCVLPLKSSTPVIVTV